MPLRNGKNGGRGEAAADPLRLLPKVDLHCHLDGSVRVRTALELARAVGVQLPADNVRELKRFVQVAPTCRSLAEFLEVFHVLYPLLRGPEAVERIAYELAEDCAADNIRHVEVRFAPLLQSHRYFSPEDVIEAVLKGLSRGERDFGVTSGAIVCLFRSHSPSVNRRAFKAMKAFYGRGVVGLDVAGDEARYPTREFSRFFEEANALGIPTTCHAGETKGTENLRAALDLEVRRIGHGTHLLEDDKLAAEVVRRGTPLEIGLTSNVRTKAVPGDDAHPITEMRRRGVAVTLNTDDRGILGIDLTHEYHCAAALGFSLRELGEISRAGAQAAFLPLKQKKALVARFDAEIRDLLRKHENNKRQLQAK